MKRIAAVILMVLMISALWAHAESQTPSNDLAIRDSSSRKSPILYGEALEKPFTVTYHNADAYDVTYTARLWVSEIYRGAAAERFLSGKSVEGLQRKEDERIVIRLNAQFVKIDSLGDKSTTDDPKIEFNYFQYGATGYNGTGSEYYNAQYVNYRDTLKDVYEGGKTDAYYWFEVAKDDEAPRFHVESEYLGVDDWFSLVGPDTIGDSGVSSSSPVSKDGFTYEPLDYESNARNPQDYNLKLVYFSGVVVQVIEGDGETAYRIATNGDSGNIVLVHATREEDETRILEKDVVTVYAISSGVESYQSTLGGKITIPSCTALSIEIG